MNDPFRPALQRIQKGTELQRFKTNDDIFHGWVRDAKTRLSDSTLSHRGYAIKRFLDQWGSNLILDLSVAELKSYIEVYAAGCKSFRRGGLTRYGNVVVGDRCDSDFNLKGCGYKCPGYAVMEPGTVEKHLESIKDLYDYLVDLELLPFNLMEQAKKSWLKKNHHRMRKDKLKRSLSREEVLQLFHNSELWDLKITIAIGCKTGLRASEIVRLRCDPKYMDPDLTWMRIPPAGGNNGKRKGNDYLVIDAELRRILRRYLEWRTGKMIRVHGKALHYPELVITYRAAPITKSNPSEAINLKLRELAVKLHMMREDAKRGEAVTSHCFRRYFSRGCMDKGLFGTRLEILRGDLPKSKNEDRYGNFTEADIRGWYAEYAPIVGF